MCSSHRAHWCLIAGKRDCQLQTRAVVKLNRPQIQVQKETKIKIKHVEVVVIGYGDKRRSCNTGGLIENEWEMMCFLHSVIFNYRFSDN